MLNAGETLGLFEVLLEKGEMSSKALAAAAGINARYCKEARPLARPSRLDRSVPC